MSFGNMLKGIGGEFEISRVLGAAGVLTYIVTGAGLETYEVVWVGKPFDLIAFCAAFPAGLGVAMGAVAGSIAIKDRNVAKAIETTNNAPPQQPGVQP